MNKLNLETKLIDANALMEFARNHTNGMIDCNDIARFPTVEAEPVRHTENTTVIGTDDVSEWKSRVMVCERNSHWGRLYYESDTKHGKWLETDYFDAHKIPIYKCSVCFKEVADHYIKCHKYCLHCGAKMDLED